MLDLRIRRLTRGSRSLTDALRLGWREYAAHDKGFPEGAMLDLVTRTAGTDLTDFFADYVEGTRALDPDPELAWLGLRLQHKPAVSERPLERDAEGFLLAPDLGLVTADDGGLCKVTVVLEDGPAFEAGLNAGDLLLAVDGMRVTSGTLQDRLDRTHGEAPVELSFYRGQELRRLNVQLRLLRVADWRIVPLEQTTAEQHAAFRSWCGLEHPSAAKPAEAPKAAGTASAAAR
jgi:predicted metalloprotease with PDZ domain